MTKLYPHPILKIKPLSSCMQDLLMDIHERELLNHDPYEAGSTHFCKGLIVRGLLEVKDFTTPQGKKFLSLHVTKLGREYLNYLR